LGSTLIGGAAEFQHGIYFPIVPQQLPDRLPNRTSHLCSNHEGDKRKHK